MFDLYLNIANLSGVSSAVSRKQKSKKQIPVAAAANEAGNLAPYIFGAALQSLAHVSRVPSLSGLIYTCIFIELIYECHYCYCSISAL